jgi:hypothetical protein
MPVTRRNTAIAIGGRERVAREVTGVILTCPCDRLLGGRAIIDGSVVHITGARSFPDRCSAAEPDNMGVVTGRCDRMRGHPDRAPDAY